MKLSEAIATLEDQELALSEVNKRLDKLSARLDKASVSWARSSEVKVEDKLEVLAKQILKMHKQFDLLLKVIKVQLPKE